MTAFLDRETALKTIAEFTELAYEAAENYQRSKVRHGFSAEETGRYATDAMVFGTAAAAIAAGLETGALR